MHESPLGKESEYRSMYSPNLLFPIPRKPQRDLLGLDGLPFFGADVWNNYDFSWLNPKGKPVVGIAEFHFPAGTTCLIESKSLKLYCNSFNNSKFADVSEVEAALKSDLSKKADGRVFVKVHSLQHYPVAISSFVGICLDDLDISCHQYEISSENLFVEPSEDSVTEKMFSNVLKSNCPVTGQPDFASVQISYSGKKINHEGLLRYIVSFRNHTEFHEHCVEKMFMDIMDRCKPQHLTVHARYTRRGGIDINPWRSSHLQEMDNFRLLRQ